jgi:hypothetical protein
MCKEVVLEVLVLITAAALLITKAMDVWSTLRVIRKSAQETNPLARGLMKYVGIHGGVWVVC